jgi:hypothetical protein
LVSDRSGVSGRSRAVACATDARGKCVHAAGNSGLAAADRVTSIVQGRP